jgi:hypothetical protein
MVRRTKVALVSIGIDYLGQSGALAGCIQDSRHFVAISRRLLRPRWVVQLHDRARHLPTRAAIERTLARAVRACNSGRCNRLIIHYSGHGTRVRDGRAGDERDGYDEALVPVDWRRAGFITDDWLHRAVLRRLRRGVRVFALIDACHSGSALDLRWSYLSRHRRQREATASPPAARVVMLSGCRDPGYSYETTDRRFGKGGALTTAFLHIMLRRRRWPVHRVVREVRGRIRTPQHPVLSSSHPLAAGARLPGFGV